MHFSRRLSNILIVLASCLCLIHCGGSSEKTFSLTQAALEFQPTNPTITNNSCESELRTTNTSGRLIVLQTMETIFTGVTSETESTTNFDAEALAELFNTLTLGTGTSLAATIRFDVEDFAGDDEVRIDVVLTTVDTSGNIVSLVGTLTCTR